METYKIFSTLFIVFLVLAILMLAISVLVFFLLRIKDVIAELSGKKAQKAIAEIKSGVASTSKKPSSKAEKKPQVSASTTGTSTISGRTVTEQLRPENRFDNFVSDGQPTQYEESETSVLSNNENTTILSNSENTTVLSNSETSQEPVTERTTTTKGFEPVQLPEGFEIIKEITMIHSNEFVI